MVETIFYILGSIFFLTAIIVVAIWGVYWLKIFRNLSKVSIEIKEKVKNVSMFINGLTTLVEKLVTVRKKKKYGGKRGVKRPLV